MVVLLMGKKKEGNKSSIANGAIKGLKRQKLWADTLNSFEEDRLALDVAGGGSRQNRIYNASRFLYPFSFKGLTVSKIHLNHAHNEKLTT
jgi:hypothetical protein